MNPPGRAVRTLAVLWPAFCAAGLIEALVFAFVDPHDLRVLGALKDVDRAAIYTLAFMLFWLLTSAASAMTLWLLAARRDSPAGEFAASAPSAPWTLR